MKKIYVILMSVLCIFSGKLFSQCLTPSVVPYYENFQSITANNQMPACWAISNTTSCLSYTAANSPGNHAAFYASPTGTSYYYTNAIQLYAGITYSAGIWYRANSGSSSNWTNLSLMLGPNQNTTGLVSIAGVSGSVTGTTYVALSNTFVISTSGVYYVSVKATSNGTNGFQLLEWDDLFVTIPCTPLYNTVSINATQSSTSICSGESVTLAAVGANTYSWNTGATAPNLIASPLANSMYSVARTNTLTGCTKAATLFVQVNPTPSFYVIENQNHVCAGSTVVITAAGNANFSWSNGQLGTSISVSPTVTTNYTATATTTLGCSATASLTIFVNPLPVITVTNVTSNTGVCPGEAVSLSAGGANVYQWNSIQFFSGSTITFTPSATTMFTVVGTDVNGCNGKTSYVVQVNACTGLYSFNNAAQVISVFPNPGNGVYNIESGATEIKSVVITDLAGKIVYTWSGSGLSKRIDLSAVSHGMYYARIFTEQETTTLKIIKE